MTPEHEARLSVLENDCEWLKEAIIAIKANTDKMVDFTSQVVRHEERQTNISAGLDRAFRSIEMIAIDVDGIKNDMPTLKMARDWFFTFCVWVVGTTGSLIFLMFKG